MAVDVKNVEKQDGDMHRVIEFVVYGRFGQFTDAFSKTGGEKTTYHIPTFSALKGICESIYWKPSINIRILAVRVMNPIETISKGTLTKGYSGGKGLSYYSYLQNVAYQVRAIIEPNYSREDLKHDYTPSGMEKHYAIAKRSIKKGGRRDVFIGTRECFGYVEPCVFGEGDGYYDNDGQTDYGIMPLDFKFPDKTGQPYIELLLWNAVMENGVVYFPHPDECTMKRILSESEYSYSKPKPIQSVDALHDEIFNQK